MQLLKANSANAITMTSILLGILALFLAIRFDYTLLPLSLLIACVILDYFDGKVARLLSIESALGEQLDTLNDLFVFGLVPIVILCTSANLTPEYLAFIAVLAYLLASVFRLARYSVDAEKNIIKGLPITLAALIFIIYQIVLSFTFLPSLLTFAVLFTLSALMLSTFKWKKF